MLKQVTLTILSLQLRILLCWSKFVASVLMWSIYISV